MGVFTKFKRKAPKKVLFTAETKDGVKYRTNEKPSTNKQAPNSTKVFAQKNNFLQNLISKIIPDAE